MRHRPSEDDVGHIRLHDQRLALDVGVANRMGDSLDGRVG